MSPPSRGMRLAIDAAIVGWLIGKIPCPTGVCGALLVAGSAVLGFAASEIMAPNQSAKFHEEEFLMYSPPILVAMLLGLWISRAKKEASGSPVVSAPRESGVRPSLSWVTSFFFRAIGP